MELSQHAEILRLILEVAERRKGIQRHVEGVWPLEVAPVPLDELDRQAFACRRSPGSVQIACRAVHARHLEAMPRKLQGVTTRATAQIEHGSALRRMEKGQNLLGFAHCRLTGPQLGKRKLSRLSQSVSSSNQADMLMSP